MAVKSKRMSKRAPSSASRTTRGRNTSASTAEKRLAYAVKNAPSKDKKRVLKKVSSRGKMLPKSAAPCCPPSSITLNHLTKIEGHASLHIRIEKRVIKEVDLYSEEGARFFEGLVVGRNYDDTVEMTSRICGICSTAHITCALQALENAMDVKVSEQTQCMRELLAIGERIRSHATHLYFLVLPDYLGYESALAMAAKYRAQVKDALDLMKLGNTMIEVFGGRQIHPVGGVVGGMTLTPKSEHLTILKALLKDGKAQSWRTLELFAGLKYPKFERETRYYCLEPDGRMPLLTGHILSSSKRVCDENQYQEYFKEHIDPRGTSKFAVKDGKSYRVGALARVNNSVVRDTQFLDERTKALLKRHGIAFPSHNPFHNNVAQAIELRYWIDRAEEILKREFSPVKEPFVVQPKAGKGVGLVEAPRGMLFHDYTVDKSGHVQKANIITPTVQNLRTMEEDIRAFLPQILHLPRDKIVLEIEKLIRAYDPCFSCSTHFLKVTWEGDKE